MQVCCKQLFNSFAAVFCLKDEVKYYNSDAHADGCEPGCFQSECTTG